MTRGHNIVADGWAGASNPHPHPNPPPTLKHTKKISKTLIFTLFNSMTSDGRTNGRTDGRTDGLTDKASYRVACPQLKSVLITARASSKADAMTKTCKVHLPFVLKGRLSLVGKPTVNPTFKQNDSSANKDERQRLNQNSKGFHRIY